MNTFVVDASVVAKWYLPSEEDSGVAHQILQDYASGKINLIEPTILEYEIQNILLLSVQRLRLKDSVAWENLQNFKELNISTFEISLFYSEAFTLAKKFKLTSYDASYVALAARHNFKLFTADKRLLSKLGKVIPQVRHVGEY